MGKALIVVLGSAGAVVFGYWLQWYVLPRIGLHHLHIGQYLAAEIITFAMVACVQLVKLTLDEK